MARKRKGRREKSAARLVRSTLFQSEQGGVDAGPPSGTGRLGRQESWACLMRLTL